MVQACLRHAWCFEVVVPPVNWRAIFDGPSGTYIPPFWTYILTQAKCYSPLKPPSIRAEAKFGLE